VTDSRLVAVHRFPVKSMGGESLARAPVARTGLAGDRGWAVYDPEGKLASGKHSRRFRRMDPVFQLVARKDKDAVVVTMPDGSELVAGQGDADAALSAHFGVPVALRRESEIAHQDAGELSLVGTATLQALGAYEGDGRTLDPRHLRANLVVETNEPYVEERWVGREFSIGGVRLQPTEPIERCRMVGVAQVGLAERPGMLRAISEHHNLLAGIYLKVLAPGEIAVGDVLAPD
jgi:hypothetical protein